MWNGSGKTKRTLVFLSIPLEKYPGIPIRVVEEALGQKVTYTVDSVEDTAVSERRLGDPTDSHGTHSATSESQPIENASP